MKILYSILYYFLIRASNLYHKIIYIKFRTKYDIDKSFRFNGKEIIFYGDGEIIINKDSYIGSYSTIQAGKDQKVIIGNNCMISHNVRIYTSTAIPDQDFNIKPLKGKTGNVIIGNAVWIGANVFINPGITVGENSIIGANSVVTKNVPDNAIVGGIPAKLIRLKSSLSNRND